MDLEQNVLQEISDRKDEIVHLTRQLVQIPSLTGMEREALEFMADTLSRMGFKLDIWEPAIEHIKEHPEFSKYQMTTSKDPM